MTNYNSQEQELIDSASSEYIREIYIKIIENYMGEHYCYLERSLMYVILMRSMDKTLKKQQEYMKTLKEVIPRGGGLY